MKKSLLYLIILVLVGCQGVGHDPIHDSMLSPETIDLLPEFVTYHDAQYTINLTTVEAKALGITEQEYKYIINRVREVNDILAVAKEAGEEISGPDELNTRSTTLLERESDYQTGALFHEDAWQGRLAHNVGFTGTQSVVVNGTSNPALWTINVTDVDTNETKHLSHLLPNYWTSTSFTSKLMYPQPDYTWRFSLVQTPSGNNFDVIGQVKFYELYTPYNPSLNGYYDQLPMIHLTSTHNYESGPTFYMNLINENSYTIFLKVDSTGPVSGTFEMAPGAPMGFMCAKNTNYTISYVDNGGLNHELDFYIPY